jgi:uncharacterized protein DUF6132
MTTSETGAGATGAPEEGAARRGRVPRYLWTALAALAGAGVGAAWSHFVGCKTGTCPITSNVWVAALYGGGVGLLLGMPSRRPPAARGAKPPDR